MHDIAGYLCNSQSLIGRPGSFSNVKENEDENDKRQEEFVSFVRKTVHLDPTALAATSKLFSVPPSCSKAVLLLKIWLAFWIIFEIITMSTYKNLIQGGGMARGGHSSWALETDYFYGHHGKLRHLLSVNWSPDSHITGFLVGSSSNKWIYVDTTIGLAPKKQVINQWNTENFMVICIFLCL